MISRICETVKNHFLLLLNDRRMDSGILLIRLPHHQQSSPECILWSKETAKFTGLKTVTKLQAIHFFHWSLRVMESFWINYHNFELLFLNAKTGDEGGLWTKEDILRISYQLRELKQNEIGYTLLRAFSVEWRIGAGLLKMWFYSRAMKPLCRVLSCYLLRVVYLKSSSLSTVCHAWIPPFPNV